MGVGYRFFAHFLKRGPMTQPQQLQKQQYLLRWRFDYKSKTSVFGMWNSSHITAWDKNRDDITYASIEGKEIGTGKVVRLVECAGHDFRNFQWLCVSRVNPNFRGTINPAAINVGLKILTTEEEVAVLITGRIGRRTLSEEEKGIQFVTFGK